MKRYLMMILFAIFIIFIIVIAGSIILSRDDDEEAPLGVGDYLTYGTKTNGIVDSNVTFRITGLNGTLVKYDQEVGGEFWMENLLPLNQTFFELDIEYWAEDGPLINMGVEDINVEWGVYSTKHYRLNNYTDYWLFEGAVVKYVLNHNSEIITWILIDTNIEKLR